MTAPTTTESSAATLQQYREVVASVVGFLRSQEITKSFSSISLEELIDRRIDRIEAPVSGEKPGALARLTKIKTDFDAALEGIKATPTAAYRAPDPATDANTPETPTADADAAAAAAPVAPASPTVSTP